MNKKTVPLKDLKQRYESVCNGYIKKFEAKQGYEFGYWVANDIGGIAVFIDQYFFSLSDIIEDINNKIPKGLIFEWQDKCTEKHPQYINYRSYAMGLRFKDLK